MSAKCTHRIHYLRTVASIILYTVGTIVYSGNKSVTIGDNASSHMKCMKYKGNVAMSDDSDDSFLCAPFLWYQVAH